MEAAVYEILTEDCKKIREEVFMTEQGFQNEFDMMDEFACHVVLYDGEEPAATGRVYPDDVEPSVFHIGRIAVRRQWRGRRFGILLMKKLEEQAILKGAKSIELSAQTQAHAFYERAGYHTAGDLYMDEHVPHIKMVKEL